MPNLEEEDAQLEEGGFGVDDARARGGWAAGFEGEGDEGLVEVGCFVGGAGGPVGCCLQERADGEVELVFGPGLL